MIRPSTESSSSGLRTGTGSRARLAQRPQVLGDVALEGQDADNGRVARG